jgi:cytochrome c oxidase assembly factor CtaG
MLLIALVSPLHRLGGVLFSAHMAQHELLMAAAAPLLVLGRPLIPVLWVLPMAWRRNVGAWAATAPVRVTWQFLTLPLVAWILHAVAIWSWHAPALYQATLDSETVHSLQHGSFLGTALLFWWALLHPAGLAYLIATLAIVASWLKEPAPTPALVR